MATEEYDEATLRMVRRLRAYSDEVTLINSTLLESVGPLDDSQPRDLVEGLSMHDKAIGAALAQVAATHAFVVDLARFLLGDDLEDYDPDSRDG